MAKIRIFQPIVPEYRKALFEGLAEHYGSDIEVLAADRIGQDESVPLSKMRFDYAHSFKKIGPFTWQKGLTLRGLDAGDVIVVCGDIHQLSSLWIAWCAKVRGIKVVWWGHHKTATSTRLSVAIRLAVARLFADVMLVYTRTGIDYLRERGFEKVFATGNTIDQEPIKAAIAAFDGVDRFNGRKGLLCCSVLREKVKLDQLIRVLTDERLNDVALAVIGDGPKKSEYERVAAECGVSDRIVWVGATRDQKVMAPWFLSAKAFVYPGPIGLSILHAMSYGLPVIVHDNPEHQMPEYEVMENGGTGLCFIEGNEADLAAKIVQLIQDEPKRTMMAQHCRDLAYHRYSMRQMIANFVETLEAART